VPAPGGFLDALRAISAALEEMPSPSMIIGGVAVIALGVPRLTVDIDATVHAAGTSIETLAGVLARHGIGPRMPDAEAFARVHQVYLGVHLPSQTPVDVSLAWLPFEEEALQASHVREYAGIRIRVPRPDDLIVFKLVACRPRDLDDAEGLLLLHHDTIDLMRVRRLVRQFADVLEDDERPQELERLIAKVRPAR
jgi:hypothetical protein